MSARTPQDLHRLFVAAFNAADAHAILALYEPDGALVPQPGQVAAGRQAIEAALQQYLALKGTFAIETTYCIEGAGLALLRGRWTLTFTGPDGKATDMRGNDVEVARRQPNGHWLFVIDHPFGAD